MMITYPPQTQKLAAFVLFTLLLYVPSGQGQSLSKEMQADQHLLEAQDAYREGNHRQAVEAFQRIESLGVTIPSEFHFFYGSSLAETGDYADALAHLTKYLKQGGRDGRHYQNALRLHGESKRKAAEAESQRKAERRRKIAEAQCKDYNERIRKLKSDLKEDLADGSHYPFDAHRIQVEEKKATIREHKRRCSQDWMRDNCEYNNYWRDDIDRLEREIANIRSMQRSYDERLRKEVEYEIRAVKKDAGALADVCD